MIHFLALLDAQTELIMGSSVFVAVENIINLRAQETESLHAVKDDFDCMIEALRYLKSFLISIDDARQEQDEHSDAISDLVPQIRDVAYRAENVIETFLHKTSSRNASNFVERSVCFLEERLMIWKTKSDITKTTTKIDALIGKLKRRGVKESTDGKGLVSTSDQRQKLRRYYHNIGGSNIVGLDGQIEELVKVLVNNKDRKVVSIFGRSGLGKTTLAKKVHDHHRVRDEFVGRAWVHVSQPCRTRKVWEDVLFGLGLLNANGSKKSNDVLAEKLYKFLKENKCLVILDDIRSLEDWDGIKIAFPNKSDSEVGSKILLTSRDKLVCRFADPEGHVHEMETLRMEHSWELFHKIAFSGGDFREPSRMEILGRDMILPYCSGLPLAIVLVGGVLATKSLEEREMALNHFNNLASGSKSVEEVLAFAYDDLPYYLKLCFLYLNHFPGGYEINVVKLIQLWITEGLVPSMQCDNERKSVEDIAESYLMELVERCMIRVGEREANLKIKTCYMHDVLRDLCLSKASKENFMCVFKKDFSSRPTKENFMCVFKKDSSSRPTERLAIHEYIPIKYLRNPNLRSLLFFNEVYPDRSISSSSRETAETFMRDDKEWISMIWTLFKFMHKFRGILSYIFNNFKLLRVLDLEGAQIYMEGEFLRDIGKLTRLRYLCLKSTTCVSRIPSSLGNLKWLQTLDLRMNEEFPIHIPDVIHKIEMLIHLYLPILCDSNTKLRLNTLRHLRTLVNFNSKNCRVEDLCHMTNLTELSIIRYFYIDDFQVRSSSDRPAIISSEHLRSFSISRPEQIDLTHLTHLLSTCSHISDLSLTVSGVSLPALPDKFSDQITFMSLSETDLSNDPMSTLEKLPNLRVLELHKALIGEELHCSTHGFPELDSLKLTGNSNVESWIIDEQPCMPKLRRLEIVDCKSLKMLPDGLMHITTLEELKIELMPKAFKDRLCDGDEYNKIERVPSVIFQNCY